MKDIIENFVEYIWVKFENFKIIFKLEFQQLFYLSESDIHQIIITSIIIQKLIYFAKLLKIH